MSNWEKFKIITNGAAMVFIPIIVAWLGHTYTKAISEREIQGKFVELAVEILRNEPKSEDKALREWGTEIIDKYSGVPLTKELKKDFIDKTQLPEPKITPASTEERIKNLLNRWRPVFNFITNTYDNKISKLIKQGLKIIPDKNDDKIIYDADENKATLKSYRRISINGRTPFNIIYQPAVVKDGYLARKLEIHVNDGLTKAFNIIFSIDSVTLISFYKKYDRFDTTNLKGFLENTEIKERIAGAILLLIESSVTN